MSHWDSPAAMVWMSGSTQALLGLIHLGPQSWLFTLSELKTQPVETLAGKAFQSKLHNIIQYIHNETLGQSSSNGLVVMVHTVTVTDLA